MKPDHDPIEQLRSLLTDLQTRIGLNRRGVQPVVKCV